MQPGLREFIQQLQAHDDLVVIEKRVDPRDISALITSSTKAVLLNFPCNPTGATLSLKDMKAIAKFALKHDLLLMADEVYSELTYDSKPISFAALPELRDNLVLLNGFSKSWAMTGFRLGYACGPVSIIDTMMKIHQYGIMSAPTLSQAAGAEDSAAFPVTVTPITPEHTPGVGGVV